MSGFFRSRARCRICLFVIFAALPVTIFAAAAQGAAPASLTTVDSSFNYFGTAIFALAVIHTFLAAQFMKLAHKFEQEHREEILRRGEPTEVAEAAAARDEVSFKAETFHFLGEIEIDRKSTRLNSSHGYISYAVFCLKKKNKIDVQPSD